mmetsp:Transcript_47573/g.136811  ORF Transcript_47573/g.136811 Transcript_47573/m.136811 type:complete len:310 (-) Transcript_47573:459-1388(-)
MLLLLQLGELLWRKRRSGHRPCKPRVLQDGIGTQPLRLVLANRLAQDIPQPARHLVPWRPVQVQIALDCPPHRGSCITVRAAEWHLFAQQEVQDDACTKYVHLEAVGRSETHLRRDVAGRSATPRHLLRIRHPSCQTEVRNDHGVLWFQQDVFGLDVAMDDIAGMDVRECAHRSLEDVPGVSLHHSAMLENLVEQVAARCKVKSYRDARLPLHHVPKHTPKSNDVLVRLHLDERRQLALNGRQLYRRVHLLHGDLVAIARFHAAHGGIGALAHDAVTVAVAAESVMKIAPHAAHRTESIHDLRVLAAGA